MTRVLGPYVVVHNIGQARIAVAVSQNLGRPVTLISPPGAVASMGPEVFCQMVESAAGDAPLSAVMDCGTDPGQALAALRGGCANIRLDAADDVLAKFRDMAGSDGVVLNGAPITAFDMADRNNGEDAFRVWLESTLDPIA